MKSHSCESAVPPLEEGRANRAGRIDRRPRNRDADDVYQHQRQTDGQTRQVAGALLGVGGPQHHQHEDEGEDRLGDEGLEHHAVGKAVGARCGGAAVAAARRQRIEDCRTDDGADDLGNHVCGRLTAAHAPREEDSEGDGGVDVAPRDVANRIGHGNDRETEGQRHSDCSDAGAHTAGHTPCEYGAAASHQDEDHRPDHFR